MAYQTPNVVKEIYLPFSLNDAGAGLDYYKEVYGIDLRDFFIFNSDGITRKENLNAKLFTIYKGEVKPLEFYQDQGTGKTFIVLSILWSTDIEDISTDRISKMTIADWIDENDELQITELTA